jgi:hypothetical protein
MRRIFDRLIWLPTYIKVAVKYGSFYWIKLWYARIKNKNGYLVHV